MFSNGKKYVECYECPFHDTCKLNRELLEIKRCSITAAGGGYCPSGSGGNGGMNNSFEIVPPIELAKYGDKSVNTEYDINDPSITKIAELLNLLKAGKKVRVDMNYKYQDTPIIRLEDGKGQSESISLDCISSNKFDTYLVERPMTEIDSVSIIGYASGSYSKIEYVYCNPQMNRMFAKLEDGNEVDWDFNIIDVWHAYKGEYKEPIKVTVQFWNANQNEMTLQETKTVEVSSYQSIEDTIRELCMTENDYPECDMIILFPDSIAKHIPAKMR